MFELKKTITLTLIFFISIFLISCSGLTQQFTRADVQIFNVEGHMVNSIPIKDQTRLKLIYNYLTKASWSPNTTAGMVRKEDVLMTLYYNVEPDTSESHYVYRIWFNNDGSATIISSNEREGFGKMNKKYSLKLKEALFHGDGEI